MRKRHKAQMIVRSGAQSACHHQRTFWISRRSKPASSTIVPEPHDPGETIAAVHALYGDAAREKGGWHSHS